jgi:uncharacterized protein (DUF885 family)
MGKIGLCLLLLVSAVTGVMARAQSTKLQVAATPAAPVTLEERRKAIEAIYKDYWYQNLRYNPEFASTIGDMRFNDQLHDYSVKAFNEWQAREEDYLLQLGSIDPAGLSAQEQLSRDMLIRALADDLEGARFKEWEFPLNQMAGLHVDLPQLQQALTFKTEKDYEDWIARMKAAPVAFDQIMANMSIGVEDGRVLPKLLIEKMLVQVQEIAAEKPEETPFALPLKKMPATIAAPEQQLLHDELIATITKQVLPAYKRLAVFIEKTYLPAGRTEPGISALPDGAAYYKFVLRRETTTELSAEQIHQIGLDETKRDEADMLAIATKLGFKDLASFRAAMQTNPKLKAGTGENLLNTYKGYIAQMQAKMPELFGRLPKAKFEVLPVPSFMEKDAPEASYNLGTLDGSVPGHIFVNTYDAANRVMDDVESTAYHEGIPGHHLQGSIAMEIEGLPDFRRYAGYDAYDEGWGLYSELLGKEIGFYQDPYSDYGRLENDIWRAIRLVVDTGVHEKHWTRQQMVDFFHDHSGIGEFDIQTEVNRYIAWPGQATSYKIGQLKILELRERAKKALGEKFDIRAFHDEVLDSGAMPLDLLEARVDAWIAEQKVK